MTSPIETIGPFPYLRPVATGDQVNPAAHGNVVYRDRRADGKTRLRAVNGRHVEVGAWS